MGEKGFTLASGKGMDEINGKVLVWAGRNLESKRPMGKKRSEINWEKKK